MVSRDFVINFCQVYRRGKGRWVSTILSSLSLPLYLTSFSFSSFLFLFKTFLLMNLDSVLKGSVNPVLSKHRTILTYNYIYMPFHIPKQPKHTQNSPGAGLYSGCVQGYPFITTSLVHSCMLLTFNQKRKFFFCGPGPNE